MKTHKAEINSLKDKLNRIQSDCDANASEIESDSKWTFGLFIAVLVLFGIVAALWFNHPNFQQCATCGHTFKKGTGKTVALVNALGDKEDSTTYCRNALLQAHDESQCKGQPCVIHNPSEHHMSGWPLNWRDDKRVMERICPHGIGHPDPDCAAHQERIGQSANNTHGCDGCCLIPERLLAVLTVN